MSKQQRVYEYDDPRELATFIVEYEFTSPQARFKGRSELTEHYTQLIEKFGNSRELEGRIDELDNIEAAWNNGASVGGIVRNRKEYLESQKEKTNEQNDQYHPRFN